MNTSYREFDTDSPSTPPSRSVRIARNESGGFTLIELLVVISIIALLSTVVLAALSDARAKATNTAKNNLVLEYIKALELYRSNNSFYPNAGAGEENIARCIGYEESEKCYLNQDGDNQINSSLSTYIPGPPASRDSILISNSDFRGVTYNCHPNEDTSCNNYKLIWVLKGSNSKCIKEATSSGFFGNRRCEYVMD